MDKLEPPKSLILTGNLAENWRRFKQQFEIYQIASALDKKDGKVQAMALLHVVGIEALEVYNTFQWDTEGDNVKARGVARRGCRGVLHPPQSSPVGKIRIYIGKFQQTVGEIRSFRRTLQCFKLRNQKESNRTNFIGLR